MVNAVGSRSATGGIDPVTTDPKGETRRSVTDFNAGNTLTLVQEYRGTGFAHLTARNEKKT